LYTYNFGRSNQAASNFSNFTGIALGIQPKVSQTTQQNSSMAAACPTPMFFQTHLFKRVTRRKKKKNH